MYWEWDVLKLENTSIIKILDSYLELIKPPVEFIFLLKRSDSDTEHSWAQVLYTELSQPVCLVTK